MVADLTALIVKLTAFLLVLASLVKAYSELLEAIRKVPKRYKAKHLKR